MAPPTKTNRIHHALTKPTTHLTNTNIQVLFCKLTARQRALYRAVLSSPEIRLIFEGKASHFRAITLLRKVRAPSSCVTFCRIDGHDTECGMALCPIY